MEQNVVIDEAQVLGTFAEVLEGFHVERDKVTMDAGFEALGLDSLDLVELSVKVEDVYGIDIEEDDLEGVTTVGDAVRVALAKVAARS